jgi:hypothetical protein
MSATFMPLKVLFSNEYSVLFVGLYLCFYTGFDDGGIPNFLWLLSGESEDVTDPRFSNGLCEIKLCPNCDDSSSISILTSTSISSRAGCYR